ncbi:CLUMA_CG016822, isoform A [Clunio marinus]|uniref:CLUMA_CG016822, isoform A n=1 Tax=Clunio marinus TaxID=568069 RepID=A0A1J1IUZ3_9DIPT|nr:CLUMA_CG016822, isoform A [Clunio marinus]
MLNHALGNLLSERSVNISFVPFQKHRKGRKLQHESHFFLGFGPFITNEVKHHQKACHVQRLSRNVENKYKIIKLSDRRLSLNNANDIKRQQIVFANDHNFCCLMENPQVSISFMLNCCHLSCDEFPLTNRVLITTLLTCFNETHDCFILNEEIVLSLVQAQHDVKTFEISASNLGK